MGDPKNFLLLVRQFWEAPKRTLLIDLLLRNKMALFWILERQMGIIILEGLILDKSN